MSELAYAGTHMQLPAQPDAEPEQSAYQDETLQKMNEALAEAENVMGQHVEVLTNSDEEVQRVCERFETTLRGHGDIQRAFREKSAEYRRSAGLLSVLSTERNRLTGELTTTNQKIEKTITEIYRTEVAASLYHDKDDDDQPRIAALETDLDKLRGMKADDPDFALWQATVGEPEGGVIVRPHSEREKSLLREIEIKKTELGRLQTQKLELEDEIEKNQADIAEQLTKHMPLKDQAKVLRERLRLYGLSHRIVDEHGRVQNTRSLVQELGGTATVIDGSANTEGDNRASC